MNFLNGMSATTLAGEERSLQDFAGNVVLVVNTASKCGFTPQYEGLEALFQKYHERGFEVLGFPCNQFGKQEPGDSAAIDAFCDRTYGVTFPLFAKVEVNGDNAHPLFRHLKQEAPGIFGTESIKWNFTKFLIARDGRVVKRFAPTDKPESLADEIEALL